MRKSKQIFAVSICLRVSAASAALPHDTGYNANRETLKTREREQETLISPSASHLSDDLKEFLMEIEFVRIGTCFKPLLLSLLNPGHV